MQSLYFISCILSLSHVLSLRTLRWQQDIHLVKISRFKSMCNAYKLSLESFIKTKLRFKHGVTTLSTLELLRYCILYIYIYTHVYDGHINLPTGPFTLSKHDTSPGPRGKSDSISISTSEVYRHEYTLTSRHLARVCYMRAYVYGAYKIKNGPSRIRFTSITSDASFRKRQGRRTYVLAQKLRMTVLYVYVMYT